MTKRTMILVGGLGVVALTAGAVWYFVFRSDALEEVSLSSAVESLTSPTTISSATAASGANPSPSAVPASAAGINGNWAIASGQQSFAGYRVGEELAQVGVTTAVGRTSAIEGSYEIDANVLVAATVEADLTRLESDKDMRDRALRDQALETSRFPTATFATTAPLELPATLADGSPASLQVAGDLTLHGVTRAIELPVEVVLQGEYLVLVGSIEIVFADYGIGQPRSNAVLSIDDHGVMEFQLILERAVS